ncbi:conjugal transfer protein TrbL family protein [Desulfitobacterium hafniense]|nr:conjugal transfer protein TrbL family protein [Desulfitobacterium hafniense]
MFIWDFVADTVLGQIVDWLYGQIIGFLGNFFAEMGNMGADLFEMSWVQSIILFFVYLAWALYVTGLVVSAFECGIEYQSGRGSIKDAAMNAIKGFMAVGLFSVVPVELYKLSISLQSSLTDGISGFDTDIGTVASNIISDLSAAGSLENASSTNVFGFGAVTSPIMILFVLILMGYAVIKVFFANLKRGGILLIQIAVGSLYMFSVPRGYLDGFVSWCKQIVGLCLTAFLQSTILIAGLMVVKEHALLGLGLMLSAGEIPRIAEAFGLDTSTKTNLMSAAYTAQTAVNMTRTVVKAVGAK